MSHLIELKDIQKSYKNLQALRGVSLTVGDGITGLLGPNGAGKSTLIKVLMGLVKVNSGSGTMLGCRLGKQDRQIRSMVGYMPEDDCYIVGMTGIEMVKFSAELAGIPPVESLRRSHEILDFCGLNQERYRSVEGYSTGMRQKAKFAAAIVHDPVFLILDEPTSGLDPEEREALLNRVRVLCERFNKSALISTHILPDVQAICDNVVILAEGTVKVSDSLKALNRPAAPDYITTISGDTDAFLSILNRAGFVATNGEVGSVVIRIEDESLFPRLWALCDKHSIAIKSIVPTKNSMEEIFMAAITNKGGIDANS